MLKSVISSSLLLEYKIREISERRHENGIYSY